MAAPDMDVIKEIPGYKVILKAILKSQIQQLVEQLASHTDEESIILTASVSDGTLSHLGSDSGKNFLDDHEDVKSQFLGFCLKHHHRKKQIEKERQQQLEQEQQQQRMMPSTSPRYGQRPGFMPHRSPRHFSPRFSSPRMPMRSPGARHEPYPVSRPIKRPNFNQSVRAPGANPSMRLPLGGGQVIKIEAEDSDQTETNQSVSDNAQQGADAQTNVASSSQPSSPSQTPTAAAKVKSESSDKEDDAKSESSSSTIPNEASDLKFSDTAPPEGLSLDSDLSNLISGEQSGMSAPETPTSAPETPSSLDPNVSVKVEAITESEMELEITGVEPGRVQMAPVSQDNWVPNIPGGMGLYDQSGATGNSEDMQGYSHQAVALEHFIERSMTLPISFTSTVSPSEQFITRSVVPFDEPVVPIGVPIPVQGLGGHESSSEKSMKLPLSLTSTPVTTFSASPPPQEQCTNPVLLPVGQPFPIGVPVPGATERNKQGLKLLKCVVCGKTFRGTYNMKRHFRIHTGEKPYACDFCNCRFNQRVSLNSHLLSHHKDEK